MAEQYADKEFVDFVVKAIVDNPDSVSSVRTVDEMGVLITLNVHKDDMGVVIGKSGATARSIRTLLRVVGAKNNARVNLKINEPEGGRGPAPRREMSPAREGGSQNGESPSAEPSAAEKQQSVDDVVDELKL